MGSLNINGLLSHIDHLRIFMNNQPFDILAINETKLNSIVTDEQIRLTGYNVIRNDRDEFGGGVCIFVRSSINYKIIKDFADENLELIALEIKKPNSRPFLVATWYRPPKSPVCIFDSFEQFIQKIDKTYEDIYILGDMNCDFMRDPSESHTKCLIDVLDIYQFSQTITKPTRVTKTSKTLIDLFITNNTKSVSQSGVYPLSISDHYLINGVRKIGIPRKQPRFIQTRSLKHFRNLNKLWVINSKRNLEERRRMRSL